MKKIRIIALAGIFAMLVSGIAMAAAPSKDTLQVTAQTSTGGAAPTVVGSNWTYAYTLSCNQTLSDTLPVELMISNTNSSSSTESYDIGFSKSGDTADIFTTGFDFSETFSLGDDANAVTKNIPISSGVLAPDDYTLNINITTPPGKLTEPNPKDIKVNVHVEECTASAPSCFFTDSEGDFLADCSGELVSTSEGGTFMLVNKKNGTTVATNPGQFYYNYLWTNSGEALDVEIQLDGLVNLAPKGANAVHAYTFGPSGFTQSVEAFDMVNNDGTPCGPDGPCTVHVGAGETLWVTWHLAYEGIGSSHPEAGYSCPGEEEIEASVHLVNASTYLEVAGACTTNATGYNKN